MTDHAHYRPICLTVLLCCAALAISACKDAGNKQPYDPEVAATVNGRAITMPHFQLAMRHAGGQPPEASVVLDQLIEQELVQQKALEQKLDRDPEVQLLLEAARRSVLQRVYLERIAQAVAAPGADEIRAYYRSRPELFAQRRLYTYRVLAIPAAKEHWGALQAHAEKASSLEALIPWLRRRSLPFVASVATRPAEQIPIDALPRIARLRDGQVTIVSAAEGVEVVQLVSSRLAPLSEAQARDTIENFILNQRKQARVADELAKLRAAAKVEKLGDFTHSATAQTTAGLLAYDHDHGQARTKPHNPAD